MSILVTVCSYIKNIFRISDKICIQINVRTTRNKNTPNVLELMIPLHETINQ